MDDDDYDDDDDSIDDEYDYTDVNVPSLESLAIITTYHSKAYICIGASIS